ncbi:putative 4-hydroxy-4-methyl-2-oxoglutarate aldolase [Zobellella maritima]|uniref:putative 4-hydroxy-4-methyl-2-oxoglutarate aldolase n=1 Tax=Zobellella maritima TaxID=2059725 RepID=UPI000E30389F|nr:putative 4-hydroxy-4-methyl-2-oxoglutarate aldolase [Zobellella maritima]
MLDLLPDLCDEHGDKVTVLEPLFENFGGEAVFWGQAVTARCLEDNSRVRELLATPGTGKVLVVDGGGLLRRALLGDQLAKMAVENGWEGIIVYGAVRDVGTIGELGLGVKALAASPMKTEKRDLGDVDVILNLAGARIAPGDYVYADLNGIIVSREPLSHPDL